MSVESFKQNLKRRQAELRREHSRRAWALIAGLIAAIFAAGLSAALVDIGWPRAADQWLYLVWVLGAWFGAGSLLVFGVVSGPTSPVLRYLQTGLWTGALAVATAVAMMPLALVVLLLPIGVAASIVQRYSGKGYAALYLAVPFLALLVSVVYQSFERFAV